MLAPKADKYLQDKQLAGRPASILRQTAAICRKKIEKEGGPQFSWGNSFLCAHSAEHGFLHLAEYSEDTRMACLH